MHLAWRHGARIEGVVTLEVDVPRSWLRRSRKGTDSGPSGMRWNSSPGVATGMIIAPFSPINSHGARRAKGLRPRPKRRPVSMTPKITFTFTNSTLKDQKREFTRPGKYVIGRSSDCDLQLPTTLEFMEVSRHHCVLDIEPPAVQVRDLGSRNGTYINGENISQRRRGDFPGASAEASWHVLKEGEELRIGSTTVRVEVSAQPVRETATA
jgi:hypothetical protein